MVYTRDKELMKVVHISCFDWMGGAGKAANRLHNELKSQGVDSHMLVDVKECLDDDSIHSITGLTGWWSRLYYHIRGQIDQLPLSKYKRNIDPWVVGRIKRNLKRRLKKLNPDIVHIHWTSATASLKELSSLPYPTVWTMHDNNLATGGCCYSHDCIRYKDECGMCPQLNSSNPNDLSNLMHKKKQEYFHNSDITFVVLSEWQKNIATSSLILRDSKIVKIANGVDTHLFSPKDMIESRKSLSLPLDRKLIAFGAEAISNPLKGGVVLNDALSLLDQQMPADDKPIVVTFGRIDENRIFKSGLKTINLGYLDVERLAMLYSAVDVTVVPSLEDNCPQVPLEAQACGCPVVGFAGTGVAELVDDGHTGFIVEYNSKDELCHGIISALKTGQLHREYIREYIESNYDIKLVAKKYLELYMRIVKT